MGMDCPHCNKEINGWVPEERLQKATADRRDAQAKAAELASQLDELSGKAAGLDGLTSELAALRAETQKMQAAHKSQIAVMGYGITDPDDVADLLAIHARRAPEGLSVGDWLADSANLPKSISAMLAGRAQAAQAPAQAPASAPATQAGAALPRANTGAIQTPPSQALPSAHDLGKMTTAQYRAQRDQILAALTNGTGTV